MGKAIILQDSDFSIFNLGFVTKITSEILPYVTKISSATTFRVEKDGIQIAPVSWSINNNLIASLVDNGDGTCTVTPLLPNNRVNVVLTASTSGEEIKVAFVPCLRFVYDWYIDTCTDTPSQGNLYDANLVNGGWAHLLEQAQLLQGNKINCVKFIPSKSGVLNFYKAPTLSGPVTLVASITIASAQVGQISTFVFSDVSIGTDERFIIGEANSDGGFRYLGSGGTGYPGFNTKVPQGATPTGPGFDLNFSIGYYGEFSRNFADIFVLNSGYGLNYQASGGVYGAISTITMVENTARICTNVNVNSAVLLDAGYSHVRVAPKAGYELCFAGADSLSDTSSFTWEWFTEERTLQLKDYMCFHIKKTNGQAITEGTDLDTYMTYTLI